MGKDRNKPLFVRLARRDHFDDTDVSKNPISNRPKLFLDLQIQLTIVLPERFVPEHEG